MKKIKKWLKKHPAIKTFGYIGFAVILIACIVTAIFQHEITRAWDRLLGRDETTVATREGGNTYSAGRDQYAGDNRAEYNIAGDYVEGDKYVYKIYGYQRMSFEDTLAKYPDFEDELTSMLEYEYAEEAKFALDTINGMREQLGMDQVYTDPFLDLGAVKTAGIVPASGNIGTEGFYADSDTIQSVYLDKYRQGTERRIIQKIVQLDDFSDASVQTIIDNLFVPQADAIEIGVGVAKAADKYNACVYIAVPKQHTRGGADERKAFNTELLALVNASRTVRGLEALEDYDQNYSEAAQEVAELWGKNGAPITQMYIPQLSLESVEIIYSRMALRNVGTYYEYLSSVHIQFVTPHETIERLLAEDIKSFGVGLCYNRSLESYYVVLSIQEADVKNIDFTR